MGRRDAVAVILEVIAHMRALDPRLVVTWEPGWETRGNGTSANYEGGIWHHTAFLSSALKPFPAQTLLRVGRSDLPGPLCNFAGPWCLITAPRIHVMAAHPANHAGASGGRSMGPLPVTRLFNPRVLGLEIDYAGLTPMSDGQLHVARLWAAAVADVVGGGDINRVRGHYETSVTGKWDPGYAPGKTYDLNALRREADALTTAALEVEVPLTQTDVNWISDTVFNRIIGKQPDGSTMEAWEAFRDAAALARTAAEQATRAAEAASRVTSSSVSIDAASVASALASNPDFVAAIARAVNDDAARRMQA